MITRPRQAKDLTGRRFGRLTALQYVGVLRRKAVWQVRCICGAVKNVVGVDLVKGSTRSCGCLREETVKRPRSHGMTKHPAYWVWRSMRDRCRLKTHHAWMRYGGRGIRVCRRWHKFENFWADMGSSYRHGLTLERRDNSRGYSPKNCLWATRSAQARNTRASREIDTPSGRMLLCEAATLSGINATTLAYRVAAGWPVCDLFEPPSSTT